MRRSNRFLVGIALTALLAGLTAIDLPAQSIYGTLTGIVSDPSGAVLPGASLKLRDENSGSLRDTVANATVLRDPAGNRKLNKMDGKRNRRIDGAVALAMALGQLAKTENAEADVSHWIG